ncbi:hypothetical protein, partial [Salmonella enterica]|uniref:hypothetical protein n=1 Tax=Salmonella enterica TaxID=28901 RepID=UPI0038B87761
MPPVLQIYNIIRARPSFIFTCSDAITDSNAFIREALRFYTDCQSLLNLSFIHMSESTRLRR